MTYTYTNNNTNKIVRIKYIRKHRGVVKLLFRFWNPDAVTDSDSLIDASAVNDLKARNNVKQLISRFMLEGKEGKGGSKEEND